MYVTSLDYLLDTFHVVLSYHVVPIIPFWVTFCNLPLDSLVKIFK